MVETLPKGAKVVIDEIQKLPLLLDEIHAMIFDFEDRYKFALTGSSARRLKKHKANLLAGRALRRDFFGLTKAEMADDFNIEKVLTYGTLPQTLNLKTPEEKKDYLLSYVDQYLKEEVQAEAAVRNLSNYYKFLKHASIMNGQVLNLNAISSETAVKRSTLDGYFNIVEETLLGTFVEPLHLRAKVKEVSNPKFYFFDCGVVRALRNDLDDPLKDDKGLLLETFILNEIRAYSSYNQKNIEINYWGTPSENEVDFILTKGQKRIGIEVKAAKTWKDNFGKSLSQLMDHKKISRGYGVYLGEHNIKNKGVSVLTIKSFCDQLFSGEMI
ncbi:MAG: hypothetical protein A4S09_10505 [Proteobacteria bacterium SG_bin7]|nr:MAG: hypothetical protein A4S09_10505 [Proteobacteria bacterium SG_bin7]